MKPLTLLLLINISLIITIINYHRVTLIKPAWNLRTSPLFNLICRKTSPSDRIRMNELQLSPGAAGHTGPEPRSGQTSGLDGVEALVTWPAKTRAKPGFVHFQPFRTRNHWLFPKSCHHESFDTIRSILKTMVGHQHRYWSYNHPFALKARQ